MDDETVVRAALHAAYDTGVAELRKKPAAHAHTESGIVTSRHGRNTMRFAFGRTTTVATALGLAAAVAATVGLVRLHPTGSDAVTGAAGSPVATSPTAVAISTTPYPDGSRPVAVTDPAGQPLRGPGGQPVGWSLEPGDATATPPVSAAQALVDVQTKSAARAFLGPAPATWLTPRLVRPEWSSTPSSTPPPLAWLVVAKQTYAGHPYVGGEADYGAMPSNIAQNIKPWPYRQHYTCVLINATTGEVVALWDLDGPLEPTPHP